MSPDPKKYVKALYDYQTPLDKTFAFQAGEVLYVIGQENDRDWWIVCNPITKKSGMVPVKFLKVIEEVDASSGRKLQPRRSKRADTSPKTDTINTRKRGISNAQAALCGEIVNDFVGTTTDQLSVRAGEIVVVVGCPIATPGWISVKPIGKSVTPGLIPRSYVQVYDAHTREIITDIRSRLPKSTSMKQQIIREEILSACVYGCRSLEKQNEYQLEITLSKPPFSRKLTKTYYEFRQFHLGLLNHLSDFTDLQILIPNLPPSPAPAPPLTGNSKDTRQKMTQLTSYLIEICELPPKVKDHPLVKSFFGEPTSHVSKDCHLNHSSTPVVPPTPISNKSTEFGKVKVIKGSDIIIVRVSISISYNELKSMIIKRLSTIHSLGYYNNEEIVSDHSNFITIATDQELQLAWYQTIQKNSLKLLLYAN
ncbi:bud emergence protein 1 [Basidiobolus ranarum]|uniref:Bud emergence protein 1 n=1 Tax=Basidiobolus ranarum TaxID=34480 RepID=A0ABR2WEF1_9FUNG